MVGQQGCVEGTVTRVTYARNSNGSPTFVDLGNAFTAVVWVENRNAFPGIDRWRGRRIRVSGPVESFRDKPQIVLRRAAQVEMVGP